jgi:hypothetical protein
MTKSRHQWGPDDVCKRCGIYRSGYGGGRTGSLTYYTAKGGVELADRAPSCRPTTEDIHTMGRIAQLLTGQRA